MDLPERTGRLRRPNWQSQFVAALEMNPVICDLLVVALGIFASWLITHLYYKKSLKSQGREFSEELQELTAALVAHNSDDPALLKQKYIDGAVEAWKKKGQAEHYLNSLTDISNELKAEIFRAACLRHKGREPKRNPYA